MAAPMPDHLAPIESGEEPDADPPPAAEDSDAPEPGEEEASQPPPIPVFTEAQACELVEHPTTDSLKVSWAEVVQTGIDGSVPEGVHLPACSLNYELALREVRPRHWVDIAGQSAAQQSLFWLSSSAYRMLSPLCRHTLTPGEHADAVAPACAATAWPLQP